MAKTAVVNRRKRRGKKRRNPHAYGAAKNRRRRKHRRRNPLPQPKVTAYSSGDYYRRPNRRGARKRNPSMLDLDTWTRILPAGVLGIGAARWATKLAGPMENDEPGFKHALAITLAAEVGGKLLGGLVGGAREIDIAQIAAISWGGDLFMRKSVFKESTWLRENLYLEGDAGMSLGDVVQDATGTRYVLTRGGWEIVGQPMGQNEPGDVVQDQATGACYVVQDDGSLRPCNANEIQALQGFYNGMGQPAGASVARRLEAPTRDLPGGSSHMGSFMDRSAIGSFMEHTPLAGRNRNATNQNSFGYHN